MRALTAALLCLLALPASAQERIFEFELDGMGFALPRPPDQYIRAPYLAPRTLKYRDAEYVLKSCSLAIGKPEPLGCAVIAVPVFCTVLINRDLPDDVQEMVLAHEDAHCRGWPADHPVD